MDTTHEKNVVLKDQFPKVLSLKEKIAYGVGDLGNNFMFEMGQLYLLKYFTDVIGLPAATAGTVLRA